MAGSAEIKNQTPIAIENRVLTEVNHIRSARLPDGSYPESVLEDVFINLKTAVQEGGIPHAISTTYHEYIPTSERAGLFKWMGKTAVENAESGYKFHISEAARQRVAVEVDEARHAQQDLRPGVMKFFISPRMSESDADLETAKKERLADDDSIRASWLVTDESGRIAERVLQSILVRDVPLQAWVDMLADTDNPFGKSIEVSDTGSALSIMKVHRSLEVPLGEMPRGPVDLLNAVLPYIKDMEAYASVASQIEKFEADQTELDHQAEYIASRWLEFEKELAESLITGTATYEIERFIAGLQHEWSEEDLAIINNHLIDDEYIMTEKLAVVLERAKQNTLWSRAGVLTGNETVIEQIDKDVLKVVQHNELIAYQAYCNGQVGYVYEAENNRLIARQNIEVGRGCSGSSVGKFKDPTKPNIPGEVASDDDGDWKEDPKSWTRGICRIKTCSTRPDTTDVGPCKVCRSCQADFDAGRNPEDDDKAPSLIESIYSFLQSMEEQKELTASY